MIPQEENAPIIFVVILIALSIFEIVMKGISMYRAGTRREVTRFVCLFIFNTCGILPIIYLLTHEKIEKEILDTKCPN